mgnify:CR=1 FL=1
MIIEIPVYHHPDGSRTIGRPDPRLGVKLGKFAMALNGPKTRAAEYRRFSSSLAQPSSELRTKCPCECLSCQTGRPDYPCLLEDGDV